MYEFKTRGVCASKIIFDIKDGVVTDVEFENGCNGNLKAISLLAEGMKPAALVEKLKGLKCGNKASSCPDQLAQAVEAAAATAAAGMPQA